MNFTYIIIQKKISHIEKDTVIENKKYNIISAKSYLFIKSKGLTSIKLDNEFYAFKSLIRVKNKRENIQNGC